MADESACTPGSVSPSPRGGGGGGHPSGVGVATGLVRSTRGLGRAALVHSRRVAYAAPLDLAPDGVYLAAQVALGAGGLLHHRFTLTGCRTGTAPAVCFLWHCPAGHPGWALPTILPCGARTFLGGPTRGGSDATARPARPPCRPWYPGRGGRRPGCPGRQPKARRYACGLTPVTRRKRSRNAVAEPKPPPGVSTTGRRASARSGCGGRRGPGSGRGRRGGCAARGGRRPRPRVRGRTRRGGRRGPRGRRVRAP